MATRHEVKCVNQSNGRITHIGDGATWRLSEAEAIRGIKEGKWSFYVYRNGRMANVIIAVSAWGLEYLKTEADATTANNLLSLYECVY